jgi:hypothetical protein
MRCRQLKQVALSLWYIAVHKGFNISENYVIVVILCDFVPHLLSLITREDYATISIKRSLSKHAVTLPRIHTTFVI